MAKNSANFFWTSYSDLMTSLFFVMLLLFIVTVGALTESRKELEEKKRIAEEKIKKIEEMDNAIKNIDSNYFEYNDKYKKHILKIKVGFQPMDANINNIGQDVKDSLVKAGRSIKTLIAKNDAIKYVLIVEGQASRDGYPFNDELSYQRALGLKKYWEEEGITFDENVCEIIVAGSGIKGAPRDSHQSNNQRFMITLMYKSGIIEKGN